MEHKKREVEGGSERKENKINQCSDYVSFSLVTDEGFTRFTRRPVEK